MAVSGRRVTVTTTPVMVSSVATDRPVGQSIRIRNSSGLMSVDLGGPDVAAGSGFLLEPAQSLSLSMVDDEPLYAVVASGSAVLHVLEVGV